MSGDESKPKVPDLMKNLQDSIDQARALSRQLRTGRQVGHELLEAGREFRRSQMQAPPTVRASDRDHLEAVLVEARHRDQARESEISSKTGDQHIAGLGFTTVDIDAWLASAVRSGGVIETLEVRSKLPEKFFDGRSAGQERRITVRFANGAEFRSGWEAMS